MGLMRYCTRCFYPATKPDIWFDESGLCSACIAFDQRAKTDWIDRKKQFSELVTHYKSMRNSYDCIVPVSGGKDSHYQVIKCLEYGLKVLAVTATTCDLTPIGRRNLDNIAKLGVDHIEVTPDKNIRKKINKFALMEVGDISWPEHVLIFTIPFIIGAKFNIPLVVYGENPQSEYGAGPKGTELEIELKPRWLQEFGGLNGLRVSDLPFDQNKLTLYKYPTEIKSKAIFLGQYFDWDGLANAELATKHGFESNDFSVEGSGFDYENLDNFQTGIHDYFKYIKYGFGRATDIVNNHIRRGHMSREIGKEHILEWDGQFPHKYINEPLNHILSKVNVSHSEFEKTIDKFMNKDLFYGKNIFCIRKYTEDLQNA